MASAHGLDPHQVDLRLAGDTAYVVATPAVAALGEFDVDHDGHLTVAEVERQREVILTMFEREFRLLDEAGRVGRAIFRDVSTPHAHDGALPAGATHLRFTYRYRWLAPVSSLTVQWRRAREEPLEVSAVRVFPSRLLHQQYPLAAAQSVALVGLRPAHVFFAPGGPDPKHGFQRAEIAPATRHEGLALWLFAALSVAFAILNRLRSRRSIT